MNLEKSGWGRSRERQMLGFRLLEEGRISISPKSVEGYKREVRRLWEACQSLTSRELVEQWRVFVIGWWNYFRLAEVRYGVLRLDGWVRRHMRKGFWLRWHDRKGRRNALQRLGACPRHLRAASSRVGAWRMARLPILQTVLANRVLRRLPRRSIGSCGRFTVAGSNRRMRKTACPVVWELRLASAWNPAA